MLKTLLLHLICPFFSLFAQAPAEVATAKAVETPVQLEKTLSILKPDAVEDNVVGEIIEYFETAGLQIVASKMTKLTPEQAKAFYAEHKDRSFFPELISYMTSGPVIVQVLEGEDAVAVNRRVMGATDPGKASAGTIRSDFGTNITRNAVHGSDSVDSARREIAFFFKSDEIYSHAQ